MDEPSTLRELSSFPPWELHRSRGSTTGASVGTMLGFVVGIREDGFAVGEMVDFTVGFAGTGAAFAADGAAVKVLVGVTVGRLLAFGFQVGVLEGFGEGFAVVGFVEGARLMGALDIGFVDGDADVVGPTFSTKLGKRYTSPKPAAQPTKMVTKPEAGITNCAVNVAEDIPIYLFCDGVAATLEFAPPAVQSVPPTNFAPKTMCIK